jgi:hypothetical protein
MMPNEVLRVLYQFQTEYRGNPLYITGNAFRHAISRQVNASFGIFTDERNLFLPRNYQEFFDPRILKPFLLPHVQSFFSKVKGKKQNIIFFTPSAVIFDILDPPEDSLDHLKEMGAIQLGGLRNEGFGVVELVDHININLDDVELPEKGTHVTLISPMLHVPKFLHPYDCRQDDIIFWNNNRKNRMKGISPGQFFGLRSGVDVKKIALRGILRRCLFGKFGFGEYIVNYWPKEEVN